MPYPAAITAFIQKHGEKASEAIWKKDNQHEVVQDSKMQLISLQE